MRNRPSSTSAPMGGASVPQQQEDPRDATLLGRYRILEQRASGGFGSVAVCWDTRLQRRVAIKCMPLFSDDGSGAMASTVDEALAEARTSSMLSHPNIVTVYDFEWDGENAYLVMEYVDGVTLGELLARVEGGVLMPAEVSHLLGGVTSALAYAHENGVLHLDIKPANIMIDRSGTPKLGDFGMASLASAAGYGGARGGTVGYMPPEQVFGELVDERSDLFSLAVCALEALTGDNPFAAESATKSAELVEKGAEEDDLARVGLECGVLAADALRDAMAPMPQDRTPSVARFAQALTTELGDPARGLSSLRDLLDQLTRDDRVPATADGTPLSVTERAPWLPGMASRLASALLCAALVARALPTLGFGAPASVALGCVVAAACGATLPQLGSALALVATVAAVGCANAGDAGTQGFERVGAVAFLALALGGWWAACGRRDRDAGLPVLLGMTTLSPVACVGTSSWLMTPGLAALTAGVGGAATLVLAQAARSTMAISADGTWQAIVAIAGNPHAIAQVACLAGAAAAASAVTTAGGRRAAFAGQAVALLGTVASLALRAGMENGGIWGVPDLTQCAVAVVFLVLMCIVIALFGGPTARQETGR